MKYSEIVGESSVGTFTAAQAREIGSCAIIAIAAITGKSWEEVWEVAQPYFGRFGMNSGQSDAVLRELGWIADGGYWKLIGWPDGKPMTVRQAQAYLIEHDPEVRLLCMIHAGRVPHSVAYADSTFHNVLGAWKAQIRMAYRYKRIA